MHAWSNSSLIIHLLCVITQGFTSILTNSITERSSSKEDAKEPIGQGIRQITEFMKIHILHQPISALSNLLDMIAEIFLFVRILWSCNNKFLSI